LSNKQLGHSTNIQVIRVMDDWTKSLNEGTPVDTSYTELDPGFFE